ncbi:leucine-rich repeat-containing protein 24-like [Neocloeon triangulifer]|uniref:leucine-rich repeat-containing protein 24-like n=1 Tax=Neocloeon triangulifer TaxID=2078957 RepID=UPI00286F7037|nr:leucine-rich repeat-containing protein 24-like [Neocloeon triangulifer]
MQRTVALAILLLATTAALVSADAIADADWTDHCPVSCKCKWISGKKTANCRDAGLTTVPSSLNEDIQVLDINGNPIPVLSKDVFRSVGLLNLQRIYLRGCGIKEIDSTAFRDLTILIEIDLSSNSLTQLDIKTFQGNNRLRVIDLSGNPFNVLREEQFPTLPHLKTLEMKSCRLKHVQKRAFVNLAALETLNLSNNKLKYLSSNVFEPLTQIKSLSLDGNPWMCDCNLRDFKEWYLRSKLFSLPLTCAEPVALKDRSWGDIESQSFACAPKVELTDTMVQGEVGGNASFGCLVRGDPEPSRDWHFNGHILNFNGTDPNVQIDTDNSGWLNVTLSNLTDAYVGEYSCVAENLRGRAIKNLTLILPEVVTATTLSKAESWLLMAGLVAGGAGTVATALMAGLCLCLCSRQRRKKNKRQSKLSGSVSYTDQEKKLLDCSITERASGTVSFEGMSQTDMELLTRDPSTVDLSTSEPAHITIEKLPADCVLGNAAASSHTGGPYPGNGAPYVIPPPLPQTSQQGSILPRGALAPPPEFSSTLPPSAFGNIFISVKDPAGVASPSGDDVTRYPDLLDLPHRSKGAISVTLGSERPYQHVHLHHHHTLRHHHHHHNHQQQAQFYQAHQCCSQVFEQCVPEVAIGDAMLAAACATLPRRPRTNSGGKVAPLVRVRPHYDTVGPRVTASGGSGSVLSLPEVSAEEEDKDGAMSGSPKGQKLQEIPTPPPPPMCTPLPPEFVSL